MQMHAKQHSSYTETFSLLIQTQRQSVTSFHNMCLLIPLSPQSKSGFHLSQNYWNSSSCATSIRVSLNISRESHLHAVRCGHAPNAAAPEAYKCRSLIKQGLSWLLLERQHIGKRKKNYKLRPKPFFPYEKCVICPPLVVLVNASFTETFTWRVSGKTSERVRGLQDWYVATARFANKNSKTLLYSRHTDVQIIIES